VKITLENIEKAYGQRTIVRRVNLSVAQGEIVGLLGPNGAGKTTTFYITTGLERADRGRIWLNEVDITQFSMTQRARMGIGYLAQEPSIFRHLTVGDNLRLVLQHTQLSAREQQQRGERRRTEIARALAVSPKFILLDEPIAGVDPIAVEDIQQIVASLKQKNIGILITDHNVHETLSITDRAYLLFEGKILKAGTAEELASDEQVRKVYLGQNFELRR